jgi:hypothetical protein
MCLRELIGLQRSRKFLLFIETEDLFPYSEEPVLLPLMS